ncbi:hypothetical protein GCM10022292_25540 [Winogradskyella damuponensis]|uniref:Uncharacterized protein n=2 Tax=Flavobacteriaceae TaxID=49546 RepID=A0ABP8CYF4_9FLAO
MKSTTGIPFNEIFTFNNGTFNLKQFKYQMFNDEITDIFKLKGNKFVIADNESYFSDVIEPLTNDSIVINGLNSVLNGVYKRLADSLKNKTPEFKLTGKKFVRNYRKWTDTIRFVNDSVYTSNSWTMGNSDLMWERINKNGFDILFTNIYPPFVIKNKVGKNILISTFEYEKEDYILTEIE